MFFLAGTIVAGIGTAVLIAGAVILGMGPDEPDGSGSTPDGRRNFAPPRVSFAPWWSPDGGGASALLQF